MIDIVELMQLNKLDTDGKIKLVRHKDDSRFNMYYLIRDGYFELYQSYQSTDIFGRCNYIASFIGLENKKALFYGVYQVKGKSLAKDISFTPVPEYPALTPKPNEYHYDLEKVPGFEQYEKRVVINWGEGALAWNQWLRPKEVIQILPKGFVKEFPGYEDFILRYDELIDIVVNKEANRDWYVALSKVAGVYLITDQKSEKQYVGSAYGEEGIWGRWCAYVDHPHGGNEELKILIGDGKEYAIRNFCFTILRTLPKSLPKEKVIQYEGLYKNKLGSRAFGLNRN